MPASLWSGNLRLSLVLIPIQAAFATTEGRVAFRMIHAPSGQPLKGYERPHSSKELDDLKLEALL